MLLYDILCNAVFSTNGVNYLPSVQVQPPARLYDLSPQNLEKFLLRRQHYSFGVVSSRDGRQRFFFFLVHSVLSSFICFVIQLYLMRMRTVFLLMISF